MLVDLQLEAEVQLPLVWKVTVAPEALLLLRLKSEIVLVPVVLLQVGTVMEESEVAR